MNMTVTFPLWLVIILWAIFVLTIALLIAQFFFERQRRQGLDKVVTAQRTIIEKDAKTLKILIDGRDILIEARAILMQENINLRKRLGDPE